MTLSTVTPLRDDLKLRACSLDFPEDTHQGAIKRVKLPCAGTWAKRGGRAYFRRAGHYGKYGGHPRN